MNCKPGDLAFVVCGPHKNIGKALRVLGASIGNQRPKGGSYSEAGQKWFRSSDSFIWLVECESGLHHVNGDVDSVRPYRDEYLRPIRPGDISDEEVRDLYAPKVPELA